MNRRPKTLNSSNMPIPRGLQTISPKKMTMIVLLVVMGILWGRVLLRGQNGPASASAQDTIDAQQMLLESQSTTQLNFEQIKLPELEGRHDTLSSNMFRTEGRAAFDLNASEKTGAEVDTSSDSAEMADRERLERITQRLVLEAVVQDAQGRPYQAFIDDKILSVGSTLTVKEGPDQYVLTLETITEKEVLFSWNEISVVVKMAETFEL